MKDEIYDLTGDALVVDLPQSQLSQKIARHIPMLDVRTNDLIVVRESCVYDHVLMEGCVQHTLSYCKDLPGYETAKDVGLQPLLAPQDLPKHIVAMSLPFRKTKATLWTADGTAFLYSEASAATTDTRGDNSWTEILTTVLERMKPHRLHVVSLSRLLRSFEMAGLVHHSVTSHVDEVIAAGQRIPMRGVGAETGQLTWSILATISASERNLIVQRLTAGVVAKYQRNEWVRGRGSQPLGYVYDESTANLRMDSDAKEQVALAWTLLADPSISVEKLVRILADAGVTTPHLLKRGPGTTVGDMSDPASFVSAVFRYADLYRTGHHVQRLRNPFPGAEHISTLPVLFPSSDYPNGCVEFAYEWGTPMGGWVDDDIIATALSVRQRPRRRQGGREHRRVAPLAGTQWCQNGLEYVLQGLNSDVYELRVRGTEAP